MQGETVRGKRSFGTGVNDMPVAYQSRAVTELQREAESPLSRYNICIFMVIFE